MLPDVMENMSVHPLTILPHRKPKKNIEIWKKKWWERTYGTPCIGENKWPIRYRFNEHLGDARLRRLDTPLGEHVLELHAGISSSDVNNSFRIEILSADRDVTEVKIDESIHIRNLSPTLNTMHSSWPLVNSVS